MQWYRIDIINDRDHSKKSYEVPTIESAVDAFKAIATAIEILDLEEFVELWGDDEDDYPLMHTNDPDKSYRYIKTIF